MRMPQSKYANLVCAGVAAGALLMAALQSPTLIAWYRQDDRSQALNTSAGMPLEQKVLVRGEPIDAVALVLPTNLNQARARVDVSLLAPDLTERGTSSVDLSNVQDWGLRVFRFSRDAVVEPGLFTIKVTTPEQAFVAGSSGDVYTEGTLTSGEGATGSDLTMRLYRSVGVGEYLTYVSTHSEALAPAWFTALAALAALACAAALIGVYDTETD